MTLVDDAEPLTPRDEAVVRTFGDLADDDDPPALRLAVRASALACDRWGLDLEVDEEARRYASFDDAVEEAARDVIAHYADEDALVDGVDGFVFEGHVVDVETLADASEFVGAVIEDEVPGLDLRDQPGGLVEVDPERGDA